MSEYLDSRWTEGPGLGRPYLIMLAEEVEGKPYRGVEIKPVYPDTYRQDEQFAKRVDEAYWNSDELAQLALRRMIDGEGSPKHSLCYDTPPWPHK